MLYAHSETEVCGYARVACFLMFFGRFKLTDTGARANAGSI